MIIYREEKNGQLSTFVKVIAEEDGTVISERRVFEPMYKIEENGFMYYVLYDDNMIPVRAAYQYLNFGMRDKPLTSRNQSAFAIRLLYCFLSLSNYSANEIDSKTFKQLIFFLKGISMMDSEDDAMKTQRCNSTVNGYLSVYRSYFGYAHIKCDVLFKSSTVLTESVFSTGSFQERKRYNNNLKTSAHKDDNVPKYISPDDFRRIYKAILDAHDTQAEIIVHLMYGYGLRLGEVLGLTIEDVQIARDNGKDIFVLFLRNRMSDKRFQYAKGLPHVLDRKQYATKDYTSAKQRIIITEQFYEKLSEFIDELHTDMMERYSENYEAGSADIVSVRDKPDENHYLFLNRYGRILSDQTWGKHLKRYFEIAGIPIDTEIRENNLSHRFRHGFAMFHARFSKHPVGALELQKLMRHRSIASTMVYYNPTMEDEFKIKTEFQEELYEMIPELREGLNIEGSGNT